MAEATHPDSLHYNAPDQRIRGRSATAWMSVLCLILAADAGYLAFKFNNDHTALADTRAQLDQANRENADTKASLATSDTSLKELRTQLNQAKQQQTDLQAQVKKEQEAGAGLQAQLDQTRADLQSQQQKAQAEATDLRAQLGKANEDSAGLRTELDKAKSESQVAKDQLAKAQTDIANLQPIVAKARTLPLATQFKKSFWGGGFSLEIKNQGSDPLNLDVAVMVSGSGKTPPKSVTVEAGGTTKVDDVPAGANVVVSSEGFAPVNLTAQ